MENQNSDEKRDMDRKHDKKKKRSRSRKASKSHHRRRKQSKSRSNRRRSKSRDKRSKSRDKLRKRSRTPPRKPRQSKFTEGPPQGSGQVDNNNSLLQGMDMNYMSNIPKQSSVIDSAVSIDSQINLNKNILAAAGIRIDDSQDREQQAEKYQRMINNPMSMNPNLAMFNPIYNTLSDSSKIKRKIYVPQPSTFNYTGLLIGPKGQNQKLLEERTGCKILVRGKGSQKEGQPPQPDDDEEQHVLIVGDTEQQIAKACAEVERILFADEDTRNRIRQEQLKLVAQIKNDQVLTQTYTGTGSGHASLTTPYGPPSDDAYIIPVPTDCVGLVIGKGGDTIKMLQDRSGAKMVQVALENNEDQMMRNVFVEGTPDQVGIVKQLLAEIVDNQRKMKLGLSKGMGRIEYGVPLNMIGLVIGKAGETAFVALSKEPEHQNLPEKILIIAGSPEQIDQAKREVNAIVENGVRYQQHKIMQSLSQSQQIPQTVAPMRAQDIKPPVSGLLGNRPQQNNQQQMNQQQYQNQIQSMNYQSYQQNQYFQSYQMNNMQQFSFKQF